MTTSFVRSLRESIATSLSRDTAKLAVVAARLGTSPRTIQRRLGELELKYSSLREDVRREQAVLLVSHGRISMGEVAATLGYRDAGSFTRAFRRWTGESPYRYRRLCRPGPAGQRPATDASDGSAELPAGAQRQESTNLTSVPSRHG
ncbi:MAG: helix-turn-helix transcriptional regulator [Gammaproteobacteria bacterium]|nr:helix-turn-helix transcriptional regulator [Gammaproteobacteria bacterium]